MDLSTASLFGLFVVAAIPLAPTEVALIGMGFAATQGDVSLVPVIGVGAAGCLVNDLALYGLGRHGVSRVLGRLRGRPAVEESTRWIGDQLDRRGITALVLARWLPAGGTAGSLVAGSLRWSRPGFLTASGIGVLLWSTYAAGLGYLGGELVRQPHVSLLLSFGVALTIGTVAAAVARRERAPAQRSSDSCLSARR
ncbi:DedA family protein [Saccharomonospora iraqiensis]|uniref:DedA family protein n=1 Tax=Saccharomonospora iraqiensis TaxID=52698 RepID=UPI00042978C9|nr:DedA family protein [Saccharomonospora iraqiensis]